MNAQDLSLGITTAASSSDLNSPRHVDGEAAVERRVHSQEWIRGQVGGVRASLRLHGRACRAWRARCASGVPDRRIDRVDSGVEGRTAKPRLKVLKRWVVEFPPTEAGRE
jgi:hypothetical protein